MVLEIDDRRRLSEIADIFSAYYPFLKLEFYKHPHQWQEESELNDIIPQNTLIGDVRNIHKMTSVDIYFWNKVGTIEQAFKNKAGLNIQIFRRHSSKWIQTLGTDEITLEEQNNIGRKATEDDLHGTDRKFESEKSI